METIKTVFVFYEADENWKKETKKEEKRKLKNNGHGNLTSHFSTRLDWMSYLPFLLLLGLFLAVALSRRKAGLIVVPGLGRLDRLQIGTYEI